MNTLNAERAIFEQIDPNMAAGRVVDQMEVAAWPTAWGTKGERPAPPKWFAWSGELVTVSPDLLAIG